MRLGLSPKVKSYAAACRQCSQVGVCAACPHWPDPCSWPFLQHDFVGVSWTSVPSKDYWPYVQNAM